MKKRILGLVLGGVCFASLAYPGIDTRIKVTNKQGYPGETITLNGHIYSNKTGLRKILK